MSRRLIAGAAVLILAGAGLTGGAEVPTAPASSVSPAGEATVGAAKKAGTSKKKKIRRATFAQPRLAGEPRFTPIVDPETVPVGSRVIITVRLLGGEGIARHASFHVGADPTRLEYVSYKPTGRGVLHVAPGGDGGSIVVYRSSLPEGFAASEELVQLEFTALAAGPLTLALTDVRLMDGRLRDLGHVDEAASLVVE